MDIREEEKRVEVKLLNSFKHIEQLMHRRRAWRMQQMGPMGDPHRGQGRVLRLLELKPEMERRELTELLDIRPQSLGEILDKLELGGYIERKNEMTDRRRQMICLTEKGKEALERRPETPQEEDYFACLTAEEKDALAALLDKVIANFPIPDGPLGPGRGHGPGHGPCGPGFGPGQGPGGPGFGPGQGPGRGPGMGLAQRGAYGSFHCERRCMNCGDPGLPCASPEWRKARGCWPR